MPITRVQFKAQNSFGSPDTITFDAGVTNGNTVLVGFLVAGGTTINYVRDNNGNNLVKDNEALLLDTVNDYYLYRLSNASSVTGLSISTTDNWGNYVAAEYSGVTNTSPVDGTGGEANYAFSAAKELTMTTTQPGDLGFTFWFKNAATTGLTSGWTETNSSTGASVVDNVNLASGANLLTMSNGGGGCTVIGMTYKADGASGTAYTLDSDPGTFTETGIAANLAKGSKLASDVGAFTVTGSVAYADYQMSAELATFVMTGQDAGLTFGQASAGSQTMTASGTVFTMVGQDASLIKFTPAAYMLTSETGSFFMGGRAVRLDHSGITESSGISLSLMGLQKLGIGL
jgi:hypothetical protein